jgi:hypothetical protein
VPTPRRRILLALLVVTLAAAAIAAWIFFWPRARVLVGTSFADARDGDVTLRAGQPIRVLLALPRKLDALSFVELELHHGDRTLQVIPVRAAAGDDEVVFAMADVTQLVGAARGKFRVVFVRDGERVGSGAFAVTP